MKKNISLKTLLIGVSAFSFLFAPALILSSCSQNSSTNLKEDKKIDSISNTTYKSNDGNFLFKSNKNTNFSTWSKDEVKKIFGDGNETTANNLSTLLIQYDTNGNKSSINSLKEIFNVQFTQDNSLNGESVVLNFKDLNFDSVINTEGSIIKLLFTFNASNYVVSVKLGIFLKSGFAWTNNSVQIKPTNGNDWNIEFKDFAPQGVLQDKNASGYIFIADNILDQNQLVKPITNVKLESNDGNFLINSDNNSVSLNSFNKNTATTSFGMGVETTHGNETRLYIDNLAKDKISNLNSLKDKITGNLILSNPKSGFQQDLKIKFDNLDFSGIINNDNAIVRMYFGFDNTSNNCNWIQIRIYLKDGYIWENGLIQKKPLNGDWDPIFKYYDPDMLKDGNASGFIIMANK